MSETAKIPSEPLSAPLPSARPGKRVRVMHCITRLGLGGAEVVALSLVRGMRNEFDVSVVAVRGVEESDIGRTMRRELEELGVPLYTATKLPIKLGGMVVAGWRLGQAVRNYRPDILHVHTEIPESAAATMVALHPALTSVTVVRTIHNSMYWHFWPRLGQWCERRLARSFIGCVSEKALEAFVQHRVYSRAGELPMAPRVIYNGVADLASHRNPAQRPAGGPLRVLFAGRFEPQKGTDLIPQILALVPPPSSGAELVMYGSGRHAPLLHTLAAKPPAGWRVEVHPPTAQLRETMAGFDLVLIPSRYEGLCLVAVEAALAGLPIVTTDVPGLREALPDDYPWRSGPDDAAGFAAGLRRALEERAMWPAVAARTREFARQRFDLATMLTGYAQLYAAARGPEVGGALR